MIPAITPSERDPFWMVMGTSSRAIDINRGARFDFFGLPGGTRPTSTLRRYFDANPLGEQWFL
jgi:hypothetical protein